ncbi:UNVERIFIED_CONTAM: hypothetical protein HDU68_009843 [Siphonaria sp. JEL0065]|nr:hypothetical protein HDU68_009843 [Siphonaria sp. JEL0065]
MESIWTEFNAALPSTVRIKDVMSSNSMTTRNDRLKEARQNVDRCNRVLAKDRSELERKEKQLMNQIRHFASKGDLVKARIAARQISHYRTAADRNYESAAMIETRAQLMVSNHKINQAKIEALKGSRYADMYDSIESVSAREAKYAHMMGVQEEMEHIMNEGMDDVYETAEELIKKREYFDLEAEAILKQALDPKQYNGRTYTVPESEKNTQLQKYTIHFKIYDPATAHLSASPKASSRTLNEASDHSLGARFPKPPSTNPNHKRAHFIGGDESDFSPPASPRTEPQKDNNDGSDKKKKAPRPLHGTGGSFKITTLDLSIDMLKRQMIRDAYLMNQLNLKSTKKSMYDVVLGSSKAFRLGKIVGGEEEGSADILGEFVEFDFVKSLTECGVANGGIVWVILD